MTDAELLAPLLPDDAAFPDDDEHARLRPLVIGLELRLMDGVATEAEQAEYAALRAQYEATQREVARWAAAEVFARRLVGL